jgi:hypothetical protein
VNLLNKQLQTADKGLSHINETQEILLYPLLYSCDLFFVHCFVTYDDTNSHKF